MAKTIQELSHFGKVIRYPCGITDIICSTSPDFRAPGWEALVDRPGAPAPKHKRDKAEATAEDLERSMRRARANVRRIALSNDFRWFVTLTLDQLMVDRYDPAAVIRKLNQWCSNQVKRKGLRYILVPEQHKDGALHFHGFFSDALEAVASGHTDKQGNMIYNLPGWSLGFTTALELVGEYSQAVNYVCKYIGKQDAERPLGRWYYSGGALAQPEKQYITVGYGDMKENFCGAEVDIPGSKLLIIRTKQEE